MVPTPSSAALAHCSDPSPFGSAPLLQSSDWDLASIESSLSPDPSLDDLLSSTSGASPDLELDPLQLSPEFSAYIRYQFEHCANDSVARVPPFPPPTNAMAFFPLSPHDQKRKDEAEQHAQLVEKQAERNAQIALRMSPYRKLQERIQTAQRRQTLQKTKRKFSLKNGPMELGTKREEEGRFRGNLNSSRSVRRWRMEMTAICGEKAQKEMR
ncbi:hypothetical protein niasHS_010995 [Heterodera schachtii]|uniref:Uncharacterized protein n=1 Tax=Heterodera schachtii TaxID=97005 RepID=A0ABD2J6G9_HETSC